MSQTTNKFSPEVRERAVRMVRGNHDRHGSRWQAKFAANVARDAKTSAALRALGWRGATVWECQLKPTEAAGTLDFLAAWPQTDRDDFELEPPFPRPS
jgi:G:T-mismatch repair DNA endonuclease (very short patch repair protein)